MANKIYINTYMVAFRKFQNMTDNKLTSVCCLGKFAWFFFFLLNNQWEKKKKQSVAGFAIILEIPGWCGSEGENKHISFVPPPKKSMV